jgi:hypothetical protein
MINAKGETIYTNAEIAYELGLSPATVNACAKRLYGGGRIPHWTLDEARRIAEYVRSISVEEDAKRLAMLHEVITEVMQGVVLPDDEDMRNRVRSDIRG